MDHGAHAVIIGGLNSQRNMTGIHCLPSWTSPHDSMGAGTSNGKTSLVQYRTLSFFAFRFLKKRKFAFFHDFKYKITSEPVRFASIL